MATLKLELSNDAINIVKLAPQAKSLLRYISKTRGSEAFNKKDFEKEISALQNCTTLYGRVPDGLIINGWNYYLVKFKDKGYITQTNDTPQNGPSKVSLALAAALQEIEELRARIQELEPQKEETEVEDQE